MSTYKKVDSIEEIVKLRHNELGFDIRTGQFPGTTDNVISGSVVFDAVDGPTTVGTGVPSGSIVTFDTTRSGVSVSIASTSATDFFNTAVPGASTGAHTVLITAIDSTGAEINHFQQLNGTTAVVINDPSSNGFGDLTGTNPVSWIAINSMFVVQPGFLPTLTENVGDVFIGTGAFAAGIPANIFGVMGAGLAFSRVAFFYVPNDSEHLVTNFVFTGDDEGKEEHIFEVNRAAPNNDGIVFKVFEFSTGRNGLQIDATSSRAFEEGAAFWITVDVLSGNNTDLRASCQIGGFLHSTV